MTSLYVRYFKPFENGFICRAERCHNVEAQAERVRKELGNPWPWCRLETTAITSIYALDRGTERKSCTYQELFQFPLAPLPHSYEEPLLPCVALFYELTVDLGPIGGFGGTAAHLACASHAERMRLVEFFKNEGILHIDGTRLKICGLDLVDSVVAYESDPARITQSLIMEDFGQTVMEYARKIIG